MLVGAYSAVPPPAAQKAPAPAAKQDSSDSSEDSSDEEEEKKAPGKSLDNWTLINVEFCLFVLIISKCLPSGSKSHCYRTTTRRKGLGWLVKPSSF